MYARGSDRRRCVPVCVKWLFCVQWAAAHEVRRFATNHAISGLCVCFDSGCAMPSEALTRPYPRGFRLCTLCKWFASPIKDRRGNMIAVEDDQDNLPTVEDMTRYWERQRMLKEGWSSKGLGRRAKTSVMKKPSASKHALKKPSASKGVVKRRPASSTH